MEINMNDIYEELDAVEGKSPLDLSRKRLSRVRQLLLPLIESVILTEQDDPITYRRLRRGNYDEHLPIGLASLHRAIKTEHMIVLGRIAEGEILENGERAISAENRAIRIANW